MHKLYKNRLAWKSKKGFALENDITSTPFLHWRQGFRKQCLHPPSPAREAGFASLAIGNGFPSQEKQAIVRTDYPSGISVNRFDVPDPAFVKTLIV